MWVPAGASGAAGCRRSRERDQRRCRCLGSVPRRRWQTKWRAVVTAEFPGLVATSLVNSACRASWSNITDSDTRGEQF